MKLSKFFNKETIIVSLESESKEDAIKEILNYCIKLNYLTSAEKLIAYLHENEKNFNSASGRGIAYHYHTSIEIDQMIGIIGISKKGIDYDALDGVLCNYILLILEPNDEPNKHRKVINLFQEMINDPIIKSKLTLSTSSEDVEDIIIQWENDDDELI